MWPCQYPDNVPFYRLGRREGKSPPAPREIAFGVELRGMDLPFALPRLPLAAKPARRRRGRPASGPIEWALSAFSGVRLVRWVAITLLTFALLLGGWLWLRGSSLVAVERVQIAGVHGPQAAQIEEALRASAKGMTTLRFDEGKLRRAVGAFPVVKALHVATSFPHAVKITVVERPAVAVLVANGQRTAVAADGTVLGPALSSGALPLVKGTVIPPIGTSVTGAEAIAAVTVLGAAPVRLARLVTRVYVGPEGLTVAMRNGLLVYFGDSSRPHAKWLSLASVLADPSSAGASYVDVRVPGRPAAGHGSGTVAGQAALSQPAQSQAGSSGASDPATVVLAERLAGAVGGGAVASQPATGTEESESSASPEEGSGEASTERPATSAEGATAAPSGAAQTTASHPSGGAETSYSPQEGASTEAAGGGTAAP